MKDTMGAFFGFSLFCIGAGAVYIGLEGIYSHSAIIGAFLVIGGGGAALAGARFASMPAQSKSQTPIVGNALFMFCFVVFVFLLILGLMDIFTNTPTSLFLLLVAFVGAALAAWSVVRASRPD